VASAEITEQGMAPSEIKIRVPCKKFEVNNVSWAVKIIR
jgi:hypothetical protein